MQLPAVLKKRFDGLKSRRISELMQPQGVLDFDAVRLFSNDYLSLANHPEIASAQLEAIGRSTDTLWMSSVFFGEDSLQRQLERRLAAYLSAGDSMLSPAVTRRLISLVAGDGGADDRRVRARALLERLSEREREVALAVGRGAGNADIAAERHMSVATVKAHVSRLLTKLEVSNRVQIALLVQDAAG